MADVQSILIVEDDQALSEAFETVLKKEGFNTTTAYDGSEALNKIKDHDFDLILLDLLMPVMDGKEFLKKYRPKAPDTPVIVFSNLDTQDDIQEVQSMGATRYMLKAWASPKELVRIVKDALV